MFKLEEIPMFSALTQVHMKELYDQTHIKHFTKDSIVFYEGDESNYLHILLDGSIKLYKTTPKGTQIQINRLIAPSMIGEYACFEHQPFPATCEFVTDGSMGLLPFEMVYKHLNNPDFSLEIIKSLTGKVSLLSALVHKETVLSSEAKVADLMIQKLALFHRLKNNEIASMLNLTPETFSRILTKFKKEGLIKVERHVVTILNEDALYSIVETNTMKDCTNCIAHFKEQIGYKD
ncbi:Crp/Fnr family transcriptional regulator [Sulfurovum sp.]|uniref:Crp/Fnr family transcriptional regulator n=1 Tax=Sulfurovum sp. TaxID=1969726 RepID=UPI0025D29927|nr:Crp/Fnr family transcriptional regulator [Sulfurovum sp.]